MYLAVLLIIVALLVFYNEINSKMNITEYILLFISLIAIIKASLNYIKFDTSIEGFSTNKNTKEKFKLRKVKYEDDDEKDDEETMIINSKDSLEYLDSDEINNDNKKISNSFTNSIDIDNANTENKKSSLAINEVNQLLGISSNFTDIPIPTSTNFAMPTNYKNDEENNDDEIKSIFSPKVIIGKGSKDNKDNRNGFGSSGNSSSWNSAFSNDGFGFDNTMNPVNNLWRDEHGYYNGGIDYSNSNSNSFTNNITHNITNNEWSQGMDAYNKGKWQRNQYNRPSDYVDYTSPNGYGTTTPGSPKPSIYGNTTSESLNSTSSSIPAVASSNDKRKLCGAYTDLDENQSGDLVVKEYTEAKKWVAGYTYIPPINWDVPQRRAPVCSSVTPNVHKLTGLMDRGLPINALELTTDGRIADTEETVKLSNVGSMIPKFNYQEQPFSKPYV